MLKDLLSGMKKLTYSKEKKMIAKNQLDVSERIALICTAIISISIILLIVGMILIHEVNI